MPIQAALAEVAALVVASLADPCLVVAFLAAAYLAASSLVSRNRSLAAQSREEVDPQEEADHLEEAVVQRPFELIIHSFGGRG